MVKRYLYKAPSPLCSVYTYTSMAIIYGKVTGIYESGIIDDVNEKRSILELLYTYRIEAALRTVAALE